MSTPTRRTTAHTAAQLADALGWSLGQVNRAHAGGVIPPYDMKTPRWSGRVVDDLVARREELAASIPELLSGDELADALGMGYGEWRRARDARLIPAPDLFPYWSRSLADELVARAEEIRRATPPQPLGARRAAELLAALTDLDVTAEDVVELAGRGITRVVDEYKGRNLYDIAMLQDAAADSERLAVVTEVVADRLAWVADSIEPREAAAWLRWDERDLARVAAERGITQGRAGRYRRVDIAALTEDEELAERVRRDQLLGPEQAAEHAEMRRRDFDYCMAAGWIRPTCYVDRLVGRYKTVDVPLYRVGDVEDMLMIPGVDWEAVRAVRPGELSPLREHTRLPISRAQAVRAFCGRLSADYGVEVWPHWANTADLWEIDWEIRADGHPTKAEVAAALDAHRGAAGHRDRIVLSTQVGTVIRWARKCLEPGAAVVIDTETTGLDADDVVVELAVVDAATGEALMNTLVHPGGVSMSPGAQAVHGITGAELENAPSWDQVAPQFVASVQGREVLAYNAAFDLARIAATHRRSGLDTGQLPPADRWGCLMEARSIWARTGRWLPLGGGHRALDDAREARRVLQAIGTPFTTR
ncbi:Exonuclease [Sinosporangium album]|uniref:Exonuclease n=1 Tax=Sinosporangium album TaxID=504805 RepID=A0A1G8KTT5_9ACTN|nr:3'-5' exonuclease [Sinosporangium album]SDI46816.1 Exonuclease [Sinosporangium album]